MNYYAIINQLSTLLTSAGFNTVTFGELDEVNLSKYNIMPLAHIVPETSTIGAQPFTYSFSVFALDIVYFSKRHLDEQVSPFYGCDNYQDVLADLHYKLATVVEKLRRGDVPRDDGITLEGEANIEPFKERWEELAGGWVLTLTIKAKNYAAVC